MKNSNWNPKNNRFVAFLDILGFKDMVMRESHDSTYNRLTEISKFISVIENNKNYNGKPGFANASIKVFNFSDSIIIFSKDNSLNNFHLFIYAVQFFMSQSIQIGIPLKGAIAEGIITVNQSKNIYFGQPLIDAYLLEEDLKYFGVVAHNSIDSYLTKNSGANNFAKKEFFETITPFKFGKVIHKNINWFKASLFIEKRENEIEVIRKEHIELRISRFRETASGRARIYIDNTLEILKNVL